MYIMAEGEVFAVTYVRGLEEDGAKFWLKRVGWQPTDVAEEIVRKKAVREVNYIADVGGAHGRDALYLGEHGFCVILLEPNKFSLKLAKERARRKKLSVNIAHYTLPYLPLRSESMDIVEFYWCLHNIPDEYKASSLREINRILKTDGKLYSTSFGSWGRHKMPNSIYPVTTKEAFKKLHAQAGFKTIIEAEERTDTIIPYEKYWYGEFKKEPGKAQFRRSSIFQIL